MEKLYEKSFYLTAAQCGPGGDMPLDMLVEQVIETATEHANILHIGYADLAVHHIGWVLSRMSVEIDRWPQMHTDYVLRTWIDGVSRLYSTRCHEIVDSCGNVMGRVRTVWAAIDTRARRAADLSVLDAGGLINQERVPVLPMPRRLAPLQEETHSFDYVFRYSDIDINNHVTTVRYIDLTLDALSLDFHLGHKLHSYDINFHKEILCGQSAMVRSFMSQAHDGAVVDVEITHDGTHAVVARAVYCTRTAIG